MTAVDIVPIHDLDGERLVRFHHSLSPDTTYLRFFSFHPELSDEEVDHFTHVDHEQREALVAEVDGEIVGVARFDRTDDPASAEVAFVVADSYQGHGLGTLLFGHLADRARALGITAFVAECLPHNRPMLAVFHKGGRATTCFRDGVVHVRIDITQPA